MMTKLPFWVYETFLINDNENLLKCIGYDFSYRNRITRSGGGLGFSVQNGIPWVTKKELSSFNNEMIF